MIEFLIVALIIFAFRRVLALIVLAALIAAAWP
jgi:hypothetical protein